jgi:hypothetical protein
MPYGDKYVKYILCYLNGYLTFSRWRLHRRIFHQTFRPANIPTHHTNLLRSAEKMLFNFLQDPTNYANHFGMSVTVILISC